MSREVILSGTADDPQLVGKVIKPDYPDPHVREFGLRIGEDRPIPLAWFRKLVEPCAVRKQLNEFGFIEVDFDVPSILPDENHTYFSLSGLDSDNFFGGTFHSWAKLNTGDEYDPSVLIPHIDGDHIALVTAQGEVRKTLTGLIGRRPGMVALVKSLEEFLDEDGHFQPFKDAAAKHLPALKDLAESDERRKPAENPMFGGDTLLTVFSDWFFAQLHSSVGVRVNPEANACYTRLNELVIQNANPEALHTVRWAPNKLLLAGHAVMHMRILGDRENLREPTGLVRKSYLSVVTF